MAATQHNISCSKVCEILNSSFKSRDYIQKEKHGQYFEVLAIQASSMTLTLSGDVNKRSYLKVWTDDGRRRTTETDYPINSSGAFGSGKLRTVVSPENVFVHLIMAVHV